MFPQFASGVVCGKFFYNVSFPVAKTFLGTRTLSLGMLYWVRLTSCILRRVLCPVKTRWLFYDLDRPEYRVHRQHLDSTKINNLIL